MLPRSSPVLQTGRNSRVWVTRQNVVRYACSEAAIEGFRVGIDTLEVELAIMYYNPTLSQAVILHVYCIHVTPSSPHSPPTSLLVGVRLWNYDVRFSLKMGAVGM